MQDIVRSWSELRTREQEVVLATVVAASGSTYRRPGARLLLSAERWIAGGISGGCLERDVLGKAWWRTREGPLVVTYDSTSADDEETWTFGLGCNGRVDVLLERLPASSEAHPLDFIARCLETRRPGVIATVFRGGPDGSVGRRLLLDADGVRSDLPPGPLRDAVHAAAAAVAREAKTRAERIMTHNLGHDRGYLQFALESECAYVGILGPRARTERLLSELAEGGFQPTPARRAALYSPVGLHLGAEQPEEIALSILAEVEARFRGADAQSLRLRPGPIHPRLP